MHPRHLSASIALLLAFGTGTAHATPLALTTGLSASVQSGTTATLTLSATNLLGGSGAITTLNGFGLALQLIPQAGAVGTLQFNNFFLPASNGILPFPGDPGFQRDGITSLSSVNGSTIATPVSLFMDELAAQQETTVPVGIVKNLGTLQVLASASASGLWKLYAVNDASGRSYWTDALANETAFDLVPAANGTALELGTVAVVPEPSTLALAAGCALVAAGGVRRRVRT